MTEKLKKAALGRKYEIIIFFSLCMSMLVFLGKGELFADRFYGTFCFDTHFGLYTLTLLGEITKLLFGAHPTRGNIIFMQVCALLLAYALTAIYCGGAIRKSKTGHKNELCCLFILIAGIHIGFSDFTELFDLPDLYWLLAALIALFLADNDYAAFFIPVLAVTSLWVNSGFLMTFMPLIYMTCIYRLVKNGSKRNAALMILLVLITVPATFYFSLSNRFAVITREEIQTYLAEKTGVKNSEISIYVYHHLTDFRSNDVYDMKNFYEMMDSKGHEKNLFTILFGTVLIVFQVIPFYQILIYAALCMPLLALFGYIWIKAIKSAEKKSEKFMFILCLISPLVGFAGMFVSTDTSRMAAQLIIVQLLYLFMFIRDNREEINTAVSSAFAVVKKHFPVIACVAAFYLCMVFYW